MRRRVSIPLQKCTVKEEGKHNRVQVHISKTAILLLCCVKPRHRLHIVGHHCQKLIGRSTIHICTCT